ncbi:MAG: nucleoside deaminase [Planctomycetota bacterium]
MDAPKDPMAEAIALARQALTDDVGGPFGAVVVLEGRIVGRGRNRVLADHDPTAHAEVLALRDACRNLGRVHLPGAVVHASSEPCPMCLAALYWARVARVVYAADRTAAPAAGFDDAFLYRELALPAAKRTLPVEPAAHPEARDVLEAWARTKGRNLY